MIYSTTFDGTPNWVTNQRGTDTATGGQFVVADPERTEAIDAITEIPFQMQPGNDSGDRGVRALITGPKAGAAVYSNDVDSGVTSAWSPVIVVPPGDAPVKMSFDYFIAHQVNSSVHDYLRVVVTEAGSAGAPTQVFRTSASPLFSRPGKWRSAPSIDLSAFRGRSIQIGVEARDIGNRPWVRGRAGTKQTSSLVEAGFDNLKVYTIAQAPRGSLTFDFENGVDWTRVAPNTASSGLWKVGAPELSKVVNLQLQPGRASSGSQALVTEPSVGQTPGDSDLDNGIATVRSPSFRIAPSAENRVQVGGRFFFGHTSTAAPRADFLQLILVVGSERFEVFRLDGNGANRPGFWATFRTKDISRYAGRTGYFLVQASDTGAGTILEAGLDDLTITWS